MSPCHSPTPTNLHSCNGPDSRLDYDAPIEQARVIVRRMFGDEVEFMPRAPDHEEIIFEGGEGSKGGDGDDPEEGVNEGCIDEMKGKEGDAEDDVKETAKGNLEEEEMENDDVRNAWGISNELNSH